MNCDRLINTALLAVASLGLINPVQADWRTDPRVRAAARQMCGHLAKLNAMGIATAPGTPGGADIARRANVGAGEYAAYYALAKQVSPACRTIW
jgi:hypothetical protein